MNIQKSNKQETQELNLLEKKIIAALQGDIPVVERPYIKLAKKIGITEEKFVSVMKSLDDKGLIRRFGATLKHQNSGYNANAMVAWVVDEEKAIETGEIMASFDEVSHCYRRNPLPEWKYNLYTMIHAADKQTCHRIVEKISKAVNIKNFSILFSKKELKKTSMQYFV